MKQLGIFQFQIRNQPLLPQCRFHPGAPVLGETELKFSSRAFKSPSLLFATKWRYRRK